MFLQAAGFWQTEQGPYAMTAVLHNPRLAVYATFGTKDMNLDEAELMIRRALESEPNNASYLDSLGWVEFRKGQFDRALDELLRAAKTAEHADPVVFEHIGDTYLKLNRTREALEAWQKALALDPKNKNLADKIQTTKKTIGKDLPKKTNPT